MFNVCISLPLLNLFQSILLFYNRNTCLNFFRCLLVYINSEFCVSFFETSKMVSAERLKDVFSSHIQAAAVIRDSFMSSFLIAWLYFSFLPKVSSLNFHWYICYWCQSEHRASLRLKGSLQPFITKSEVCIVFSYVPFILS